MKNDIQQNEFSSNKGNIRSDIFNLHIYIQTGNIKF